MALAAANKGLEHSGRLEDELLCLANRIRVTHLPPGLAADTVDVVPHLPEGSVPAHLVQEVDPVPTSSFLAVSDP
ncbi:hypothetical protein E2C01_070158 [Portunus trituberculatus]|uniref:Uncharacterized protein n=1 Tax=Portunus trituberculatus TaxID=210409 RepID=A0A5B7I4P6_PORTR|nr:hypothetical protein [Portunus trituberculatus]